MKVFVETTVAANDKRSAWLLAKNVDQEVEGVNSRTGLFHIGLSNRSPIADLGFCKGSPR